MKNLGNLKPAAGSNKNTKRLGRGPGSNNGKTAGKGHKGQKARKGGKVPAGFEGGQTPLYRRIPKRGFSNLRNKIEYTLISLDDLNKFNDGDTINVETLVAKGMVKKREELVKLLCNGKLTKKLTVSLPKVSKGARESIEKLGGSLS